MTKRQQTPDDLERARLYRTKRWANVRRQYLFEHPWCVRCAAAGRHTPARVVDHVQPHGPGWRDRFWDPANFQALCLACHNIKSHAAGERGSATDRSPLPFGQTWPPRGRGGGSGKD
jgi:5-methylcytosine-specific restriction endonuclease McrA